MLIFWPGDENEKVSKNFKAGEFFPKRHKYGPVFIYEGLVGRLQILRNQLKKPIKITSGYRPPTYNKRIGGAPRSKHMLGMAVDIHADINMLRLAEYAYHSAFRRIGVNDRGGHKGFIHVDVHEGEAYWSYRTKWGRKKHSVMEKPDHWK